jgi:hypothetical protein
MAVEPGIYILIDNAVLESTFASWTFIPVYDLVL